jgi:hypothetical protein
MRNEYRFLTGREGKKHVESSTLYGMIILTLQFTKVGFEGVGWIEMVQDRLHV